MNQLHYFAYGSNMSPPRLQERVPGCRVVGVYRLPGHELRMHKVGRDGSAKADAYCTDDPCHCVYGVLYLISEDEKHFLDKAEGLGNGYEEKTALLHGHHGEIVEGFFYYATHIDLNILPFDWYLQHILRGAVLAKLPEEYIAKIQNMNTIVDTDTDRDMRERSLYE